MNKLKSLQDDTKLQSKAYDTHASSKAIFSALEQLTIALDIKVKEIINTKNPEKELDCVNAFRELFVRSNDICESIVKRREMHPDKEEALLNLLNKLGSEETVYTSSLMCLQRVFLFSTIVAYLVLFLLIYFNE